MGYYLDALKKKGSDDIHMASARVSDILKEQENKCAKCGKELRSGFYKRVTNPKTGKQEIVCSDCLVELAKKY